MFPRILKVCLSHLRYSWALFARHHPTHIATKIGGGGQGNSINTHILYYPSDLKYHYLGTLVGVIYEPSIKWRMGASKPLKVPTCVTLFRLGMMGLTHHTVWMFPRISRVCLSHLRYSWSHGHYYHDITQLISLPRSGGGTLLTLTYRSITHLI